MQSPHWLELRRIERTDSGLRVSVVTRSPDEPYADDATTHSLGIRVMDERRGVPNEVAFQLDGEPIDFGETN